MEVIHRDIIPRMENRMKDKKIIILNGARQTGKTTLLKEIAKGWSLRRKTTLWLNGDEPDIRSQLESITSTGWRNLIGDNSLVIVDEAQKIPNIGLSLKLLHDTLPDKKVIASGSSSFDLAQKTQEPLTGRKWEFLLYPISFREAGLFFGEREEERSLERRLIYGYYPEIVTHPGDEEERLRELSQSYLYRDVLTLGSVRKPEKIDKLLQALAFQIGREVSYTELGQLVDLEKSTVATYIDILEKAFIIFRLYSFSRNMRNEIKRFPKIYFYDNGIRNAVIRQFQSWKMRGDAGALWENFLMAERKKFNVARGRNPGIYFWRNHAGAEVDYIEEENGQMNAYEFKWNTRKKARPPKAFQTAYSPQSFQVITSGDYLDFVNPGI